jgi:hypothetical protein
VSGRRRERSLTLPVNRTSQAEIGEGLRLGSDSGRGLAVPFGRSGCARDNCVYGSGCSPGSGLRLPFADWARRRFEHGARKKKGECLEDG